MPDELAAEKGAGSDAVSTLSNYLAIRVATDRIINVGTFTEGQKQFLDYHRESVLLQAPEPLRIEVGFGQRESLIRTSAMLRH
jgi:hypothetical protein